MKKLIFALALACCTTAYAADVVPFKAAIHTNIEVVTSGSCALPSCLSLFITGTGQGSHFGRMVIAGPSQVVLGTGAQTGSSILTAADGSTTGILCWGTSVPDNTGTFHFEGQWEVDSAFVGTGRFQGENGSGTYEGSAAGPIRVLFLNGTLSNPGMTKK
jgi:hypothetical protein